MFRIIVAAALAVVLIVPWSAAPASAQGYGPGYAYGYGTAAPGAYPQPGYAPGYGAYGMTAQPRADGPEALVAQGIAKLRGFLDQGGGADPQALATFVGQEIAPPLRFRLHDPHGHRSALERPVRRLAGTVDGVVERRFPGHAER